MDIDARASLRESYALLAITAAIVIVLTISSPRIYTETGSLRLMDTAVLVTRDAVALLEEHGIDIQAIANGKIILINLEQLSMRDVVLDGKVLIVSSGEAPRLPTLLWGKRKPSMIMVVNDGNGDMGLAVASVAKLVQGSMPMIVDPASITKDKKALRLHPALKSADAVLLDVQGHGLMVVESLTPGALSRALSLAALSAGPAVNDGRTAEPFTTHITGFQWIGYIGWVKASAGSSLNYGGEMQVRVDYYYAASSSSASLGFWLAEVKHLATGDCAGPDSPPEWFLAVTDWETTLFPGQVLVDWGPKNSPQQSTISYSLTASTTGVGATLTYSAPAGSYYTVFDYTNAADGLVKIKHIVGNGVCGVTYTTEPASIGMLDPGKPGGTLPMIVCHRFETEFANDAAGPATVDFCVALETNYIISTR